MTTRPPLVSVGRPPPQRSSSTTHAVPRPSAHQRSLSQQYIPNSPTKRGNDGLSDLPGDGDGAQGRPKIGMSRLRLEISTNSSDYQMVDSPNETYDAPSTWKPGVPPRGRPQLHFDVASGSILSPRTAQESAKHENTIKAMPLPMRPGYHLPQSTKKFLSSPSNTLKKDARPKPYVLEVPAAAPHYSPNGHADFFPWSGNHPEDQFSEAIIRHGYYDKAQMTQEETGYARPSIFPALKHKSGLQTLSSLFTNILAQRRAHGQITSSPTFKPPPRVTVTDTKREMWLKDLANPTIPLRRLSRSIPHGIRGKVLLDQSLSKNIPIERAVWLAKCVGANELRSFRRKGVSGTFAMGGEAKWIRDFTVCVEQFLESIIGMCGEKDFKTRINYAIRLATHFHTEFLLDKEHYMEWLVSSLESSNQPKLPIWLLVTQIYWKELLHSRKYARRLSGALVKHLAETLSNIDSDLLAPLSDRLKQLLEQLIMSDSASFVAPVTWGKHKHILMTELGHGRDEFLVLLYRIDARNARLTLTDRRKEMSPRRRLINRLDESLLVPMTSDFANECWNLDDNKSMLIQAVIKWSSSSYRSNATKTFVATRILRLWSRSDSDITSNILNVLDSMDHELGNDRYAFYHLVSELARSEHFSIPRYLQWLISRGGVDGPEALTPNGSLATRLLAELPAHNLTESIYDLRTTILYRAQFSVDDEEDLVNQIITYICALLPNICPDTVSYSKNTFSRHNMEDVLSLTSRACKSELGYWLRQQVKRKMVPSKIPLSDEWEKSSMKSRTSTVTAIEFNTIRKCIELMDDYSMLADILKLVSSSNDPEVLASCADTLTLHIQTFAAIGALNGLFDILLSRLQSLMEDGTSTPRVFLVALLDLSSRLAHQTAVALELAQELARSDRKNAADACSPVSDQTAMVEDVEADFTDEIERVLATGNMMEQATLERLFQRITSRLEEAWDKTPEQQRSCGLLLTRLRTFDVSQFDALMSNWVDRMVRMKSRPGLVQVCGPLISFGCLSLPALITICQGTGAAEARGVTKSQIYSEALTILALPSSRSEVMSDEDAYRFRIKQKHAQEDFPQVLLDVIRQAYESQGPSEVIDKPLVKSPELQSLIKSLVIRDVGALTEKLWKPLLHNSNSEIVAATDTYSDSLLLPDHHDIITIERLFDLVNDYSLPFCQLKLVTLFRADDEHMENSESTPQDQFEMLDRAIDSAVAGGKSSWAGIVPLLDPIIAQHVRRRAEAQLLSLLPTPRASTTTETDNTQSRLIQAENLFRVINTASCSAVDTVASDNNISEIAASLTATSHLLATSQSQDLKDSIISNWLPLILSFVTLQVPSFEATKIGPESRAKCTLALASIFLYLQAQDTITESIVALTEQTFDLALHLVDGLPEEIRLQCVRNLKDTSLTSQICYLFSFTPNPSERLVLSQKGADGKEKLTPFPMRRWEMLGEPTPNVGENDTSLSLTLFGARKG